MAILNSQLFWWYLVNTGTVLANGYFRFMPHYIKSFPIPEMSKEIEASIEDIVNKIIYFKKEKANEKILELEVVLNNMIYNLYQFSPEDIIQINLTSH